ncbi:hypothetical protein [uncultured Prochlorococcus sp.]|uniref:hypothetical protein n=1 Tax=uncultured Prochlorococcus sp. TaxID=159733 RepID=UPI00258DC7FA|nr:hypothetical protein [uncultured Prochlorococcus sp.]
MPSQRKRIGFLPSEEVHEIIDKLCKANQFSQSKVTGLLVEEALRFRGVLNNAPSFKTSNSEFLSNDYLEKKSLSEKNKSLNKIDIYKLNKESITHDIQMMHEFIKFKYFKKIMKENEITLE